MRLQVDRRRWLFVAALAVLAVIIAMTAFAVRPGEEAAAARDPGAPEATPSPTPTSDPVVLTPEEQARADLDRLVRDYYAAENAVFLDPTSDPSAALDPYLRNPASSARIADILSFRNAGHTLTTSTAEVHAVKITALDLASTPATATLEVCRTLISVGTDGKSGESASFEDRGSLLWTAQQLPDSSWRMYTYSGAQGAPC